MEEGKGFSVLSNTNGAFRPLEASYPEIPGAKYSKVLVGDLQNDRFEDVIVLGEQGSHLFRFAEDGSLTDASNLSSLSSLRASDGMLIDLDFTGKLDLIAVTAETNELRLLRQSGPLLFGDVTGKSGIPDSLRDAHAVMMADWNRDGIMDVIASRIEGAPLLLEKARGGPLAAREQNNWASGAVFATGDFDNDLRPDIAIVSQRKISLCFSGGAKSELAVSDESVLRQIVAVDYDNDGWLDLWGVGEKLSVWRNLGLTGFEVQTIQVCGTTAVMRIRLSRYR
jgi:hypothetical protein